MSDGYGLVGTDSYDSAGNVTANFVSTSPPDSRTWKFDAAGRMTDWVETSTYVASTRWDQGETLTFDGDGRTAKRLKRQRIYASPPSGWYETPEYCIYSSVTGQKLVELDQNGQWKKRNIYVGSTVIAEQTPGFGVVFKTTDPVAGTEMQSELSGEITPNDVGRAEREPLSAVIPTQEPEITAPPHSYDSGGSPSDPENKCEWNGTQIKCTELDAVARTQDVFGFAVRLQGYEGSGAPSIVDLRAQLRGTQTGVRDDSGNWDKSEIEWFWIFSKGQGESQTALSDKCKKGLSMSKSTGKQVKAALAKKDVIKAQTDKYGLDWRVLAAISIRETQFRNIDQQGGPGRAGGYFQIDFTRHPEVTRSQAFDISWAADWTANALVNGMPNSNGARVGGINEYLKDGYSPELSLAGAIRNHNAGPKYTGNKLKRDARAGGYRNLDRGTWGNNYVTNVLNLIDCFTS